MSLWQQQKRPLSVTFTAWGVFLIGAWNIGRAFSLWQQLPLLRDLPMTPGPLVQLVAAALWGALFLVVLGLLWRKRPFSRITTPTTIALFTGYTLGIRLAFAAAPAATLLLPALLLGSLTLFSGWALNRTAARSYFVQSA